MKLRKIFKDKNYPILIDQEGGRVNRLRNFLIQISLQENFLVIFI